MRSYISRFSCVFVGTDAVCSEGEAFVYPTGGLGLFGEVSFFCRLGET